MQENLIATLLPDARKNTLANMALVLGGIGLLTVSAKVQVPFWPVPMTMQTLVVLLIGSTYGANRAGATLAGYLAAGAAGLPVFAGGAGLAYMVGPTGGYLAGFIAAAVLMGWLSDRGHGRTVVSALALIAVGEIAIFALGGGWLSTIIGWQKALAAGVYPFVPAEILKTVLAAAMLSIGWKQAKT